LFSFLTVPYRYRYTQYRLTPSAILLQTGFIFKEQVAVPIARVQDVTLSAGPLLQANNLQQITIATAATQHDIDGVSPEDAQHLREEILKLAQEEQNRDV
jgi:membrane protein YdbS with pleckstrin-like domain